MRPRMVGQVRGAAAVVSPAPCLGVGVFESQAKAGGPLVPCHVVRDAVPCLLGCFNAMSCCQDAVQFVCTVVRRSTRAGMCALLSE
jgi:hypothetical protein